MPGEVACVRLGVSIADGSRVYALDSPTGLPLRVNAALPPGVRVNGLRQSPPIDAIDPTLGEPVRWFEGEATVELVVLASDVAEPGDSQASVTVTFGVCDDRICLPPRTRTFPVRLTVSTPAPLLAAVEDTLAAASLAEASAPANTAEADLALIPVGVSGKGGVTLPHRRFEAERGRGSPGFS